MEQKLEHLLAGTATVVPQEELRKKLLSGKKLIIKLGVDPTSQDLHLGHTVVLSKLKAFQDMGHQVIFLIGDFTARIGDPTGRSKTRPPLTEEQIAHNFRTYIEQVGKVLDINNITIRYNAEWLSGLTGKEWLGLCSKVTLARLTEREDFSARIADHQPIGFHELVYPLLQGYDSIALHADVELGGTDQTFNLLMGRFLQEQYGQEPQVVMTVPLLPGLDGTLKMSKSLGNAISLSEPASEAYGKIMSISDELMWTYYEILLSTPAYTIERMRKEVASGKAHPMELKKALAHTLISRYWQGTAEADRAQEAFEHLFQKRDFEFAQPVVLADISKEPRIWIVELLKKLGAVPSSSQARTLISEGAVSVDGIKVTDPKAHIDLTVGMHIKIGKHRFYKVV